MNFISAQKFLAAHKYKLCHNIALEIIIRRLKEYVAANPDHALQVFGHAGRVRDRIFSPLL